MSHVTPISKLFYCNIFFYFLFLKSGQMSQTAKILVFIMVHRVTSKWANVTKV